MNEDNIINCIENIPFYNFYYYVSSNYKNITYETCKVRKIVKNFAYGIGYSNIIDCILEKIYEVCIGKNIAFFCIPDSTQSQYDNKYKKFSEEISSILGIYNCYNFVNFDKWSPMKIDNFYELDKYFFNNKNIIIFTDYLDTINNISTAISKLNYLKSNILYIFAFAKLYKGTSRNEEIKHPFSQKKIYLTNKYEKNITTYNYCASKNNIGLKFNKTLYDDVPYNGKLQFGKYNNIPLTWDIIKRNKEKLFIITERPIDCIQYNDILIYSTWETSYLRKWLNEYFYNLFTNEEKERILKTKVEADKNPDYNTEQGKSVEDYIFLLSINEYSNYLDYNKNWNCVLYNGVEKQCWLRTCGNDNKHAAFIGRSGSIHSGGSELNSKRNAIRPVMWIKF